MKYKACIHKCQLYSDLHNQIQSFSIQAEALELPPELDENDELYLDMKAPDLVLKNSMCMQILIFTTPLKILPSPLTCAGYLFSIEKDLNVDLTLCNIISSLLLSPETMKHEHETWNK